jgi:hypothetical protein
MLTTNTNKTPSIFLKNPLIKIVASETLPELGGVKLKLR